jgi:hypothetical protein
MTVDDMFRLLQDIVDESEEISGDEDSVTIRIPLAIWEQMKEVAG